MTLPQSRPDIKIPMYVLTIIKGGEPIALGKHISRNELEQITKEYNVPMLINDKGDYESVMKLDIKQDLTFIITVNYVLDPNPPDHV